MSPSAPPPMVPVAPAQRCGWRSANRCTRGRVRSPDETPKSGYTLLMIAPPGGGGTAVLQLKHWSLQKGRAAFHPKAVPGPIIFRERAAVRYRADSHTCVGLVVIQ